MIVHPLDGHSAAYYNKSGIQMAFFCVLLFLLVLLSLILLLLSVVVAVVLILSSLIRICWISVVLNFGPLLWIFACIYRAYG